MKVTQVCIAFYPEVSGATVCAEETAERLVDAGHEVTILTHEAGAAGREFTRYKVLRFRESAWVRRLTTRGFFPRILPLLKDADIIHARSLWWSTIIAIAGARIYRKKVVVTIHGCIEMLEWLGMRSLWFYRPLLFAALRRADRVFALGEWEKKLLTDGGVAPERALVVPNGVNCRFFAPAADRPAARARWDFAESDFVVLFTGYLHNRKGIDLLREAIPAVVEKRPDALFVFAGNHDTPHAAAMMEEVRRRGAESRVRLLGVVKRADLPSLYSAADVFTLPSYAEGQPRVILEAMSCGLPVVATPVQGIPEMVFHERTGLLVETGDAKSLADALLRAVENPEQTRQWGRNARALIEERFDWDRIAERTLAIYEELLGEKR